MYRVMSSLYGIYTPEVVSVHRKKETAEAKLEDLKKKHEMYLRSAGWNTDGTTFYIEED